MDYRHQSGRHSPGVERLSSFLIDSSSVADISTIADLTHHQVESPVVERRFQSPPKSSSKKKPAMTSPNRHYQAAQEMVDDQATIDEGKLKNKDSACLQSGSAIMLRAYSINATIGARKNRDGKSFLAEPSGICLGRDEEVLEIVKVPLGNGASSELRHGDSVRFHSALAQNKALGAWKMSADSIGARIELGFFSDGSNKAETWMVLSARPDREVLVGRAAIAVKNNTSNKGGGMPAPVRSGDAILLRNSHNGGILSINERGELVLRTDSYDASNMQTLEDPSLLGRLQHHDRLYPSQNETFHNGLLEGAWTNEFS
jgi:hypothetical protein